MNKKHILIVLLWVFCFFSTGLNIFAQRILVSKEKYHLLEPIEIIIESSELLNLKNFNIPNIDGLEFIGSSQNYTKIQQQSLYSYYFLFKAQKIGNFYIPSFTIQSNNFKKIEFPGKNINVYANENFFSPQISSQNKETWKLTPQDVFLEIQFNKNHAFVGEQINQKINLYIKESLIDKVFFEPQAVQSLLQNIKNTQFWEENIDSLPFQNISIEYKNGIKYQKYLLNYSFLFAFFPGSIHYESIPFKIKKKKYLTNEWIDNPFEEVTIYSNSLDLTISKVPYTNLLTGVFSLKYQKIPSKIYLGEKINYKFTINGNGNLNTSKPNPPKLNKNCDIFEQSQITNQYILHDELYYSLEAEYNIVPNDTGLYKIESLKIPYFNTQTKRKEFLVLPEQSFFVEKNDIKIIENQDFSKINTQKINFSNWNIWGLSVLMSISFVLLWLIYKEFIK